MRLAGLLQTDGGLEQDPVLCADAVADHDGHRSRQTQGAGAGDDQHRDPALQSIGERPTKQDPDRRGNHGNGDHGRNEDAGDLVRQLGDRGLGRGGVRDHLNDPAQRRVLAHAGRTGAEIAGLVHRRGGNRIAHGLVHGDGFSGQAGLVDRRAALQNHAVHRDALARPDHEDVARLDLLDGNRDLLPVPEQDGGLGLELHQTLEGVRRPALGAGLQQLADRDQGQDHSRGFKIELSGVGVQGRKISVRLSPRHAKEDVDRPDEGGGGAETDQGVHIRRPVKQRLRAGDKELLVDNHYDGGQQKLNQPDGNVISVKEGWQGPAPHVMPHRDVHQNQQEAQRPEQAAQELRALAVCQRILGRDGCSRFRPAERGSVARLSDGGYDCFRTCAALHAHRVGQQTDRAGRDARHLFHGVFHAGGAGRAAHAGYVILFHPSCLISSASAGYPPARPPRRRRPRGCGPRRRCAGGWTAARAQMPAGRR